MVGIICSEHKHTRKDWIMATSSVLPHLPAAAAVSDDNGPRHISGFLSALLARYGIHPDALRAELDRRARPARRQINRAPVRPDLIITAKFKRGTPVSHTATRQGQTSAPTQMKKSRTPSVPTGAGTSASRESIRRQPVRQRRAVQLSLFGGSSSNSTANFATR
jgi:hypothetical protein